MIVSERCQRCGGQIVDHQDEYLQRERYCLSCGARTYPDQPAPLTLEDERARQRQYGPGSGDAARFGARPMQNRKLEEAAAQMRMLEA